MHDSPYDACIEPKKGGTRDYTICGMPIYEISDLSKVWCFDLYAGNHCSVLCDIEYTVNSLPGETFTGKIRDPLINSQTCICSPRGVHKMAKLKP
jgi:Cu(I)/Ag(I) efflux system membrane fusion protein